MFSVKQQLKIVAGITLAFALLVSACGSKQEESSSTTGGGSTPTTSDLSTLGVDVKAEMAAGTILHSEFTAAPHDTQLCADCHSSTVPREQVCAQSGCHPFSKYTMTNFDHTANKTGTQCDRCHLTDDLAGGTNSTDATMGGFRGNLRSAIGHADFHESLDGTCLDCHQTTSVGGSSATSGLVVYLNLTTHTTTAKQNDCEGCHTYKATGATASARWGGGHTAATSGCNATGCHTKHYSGYDCVWCHEEALTSGYTSWSLTFNEDTHQNWNSQSCAACHGAGGFGD